MFASLTKYEGREQTYVKHLFLESYLERLLYNIFSNPHINEFVYVDGFSGPWKSADENFGDTSVHIALTKLVDVQKSFADRGRQIKVRALFIEKNQQAFRNLTGLLSQFPTIETMPVCGEFEDKIDDIVKFVGRTFSLVFVDPTGWTGFGLSALQPLLALRGEVLINFMYDYISQFIVDERPGIAASFAPLFGKPRWNDEIEHLMAQGVSREEAILEVYLQRLKEFGKFEHVTSTRIKKPLAERTYFYLVYGTRHFKGLYEFRETERRTSSAQAHVRSSIQLKKKEEKTGIGDLFGAANAPTVSSDDTAYKAKQLRRAESMLNNMLPIGIAVPQPVLAKQLLEIPMIAQGDLSDLILKGAEAGTYEVIGLSARERTVKPVHSVRRIL